MSKEFKNVKFDPKISKEQIKYTNPDFSFPHTKAFISVYDKEGNCKGSVSDPSEEVEFKIIDGEIFRIDSSNKDLVNGEEQTCAAILRAYDEFQRKMAYDFIVGDSKVGPYGIL